MLIFRCASALAMFAFPFGLTACAPEVQGGSGARPMDDPDGGGGAVDSDAGPNDADSSPQNSGDGDGDADDGGSESIDAGQDSSMQVDAGPCANEVTDGTETGIDCGGVECPTCPDGQPCLLSVDCASQKCEEGICGGDQCPSDPLKVIPGVCGCGIIERAEDADGDGRAACSEECDNDPDKFLAGQCGCGVADTDSDSDGTADCLDDCDDDPLKVLAGMCGCGVVETDADSDGTPACNDACDSDPNRISLGTCGCIGEPSPAAEGTSCSDGLCPLNAMCDGSGRCGSPSDCTPPHSSCGAVQVYNSHGYYFCTSNQSWTNAQALCRNQTGVELVRIDDAAENAFITGLVVADSWIGGQDSAVEGEWRWSDNGAQFWSGQAAGSAVGGLYVNWSGGEPNSSGNCQQLYTSGLWDDTTCGTTNDFVCETQ